MSEVEIPPSSLGQRQEIDYKAVRRHIEDDITLLMLNEIRRDAERGFQNMLDKIKEAEKQRKQDIVLQHGVGYRAEQLYRNFPEIINPERVKREMIPGGVSVISIINDASDSKAVQSITYNFYYSRPVGLWILGEPERRDDGLYCLVAGEKISIDRG